MFSSDISLSTKLKALAIIFIISALSIALQTIANIYILDPLVISMILGILLNSFFRFSEKMKKVFSKIPALFIPIGIVLYGAANLDFDKFTEVNIESSLLILMVIIVYIISVFVFSAFFKLKEKTIYLISAGSAICGASAIAITSQVIDADAEDVSNSLLAVFISALIGLFLILPFLTRFLNLTSMESGIFYGSVLQFTGFVKSSVQNYTVDVQNMALSVKALRYTALLLIIPFFSSLVKEKPSFPWYLFAFLFAGIICSIISDATQVRAISKQGLTVLWSMAMASIGLNVSIKTLFNKKGIKIFIVSMMAFLLAALTFLLGIRIG